MSFGLGSLTKGIRDVAKDAVESVAGKAVDAVKGVAKDAAKTVVKGGLAYVTGGASLLFDKQIDKAIDKGIDKLADRGEKYLDRAADKLFDDVEGQFVKRSNGSGTSADLPSNDELRQSFVGDVRGLIAPQTGGAGVAKNINPAAAAFVDAIKPADGKNISEEQLFALGAFIRTAALAGPAAAQKFLEQFAAQASKLGAGGGSVPVEKATVAALQDMVKSGALPAEQADRIYSEAFAGAQLDRDASQLFDGTGGPNDPTQATAPLEQGLGSLFDRLNGFGNGQSAAPRKLAEARPDARPTTAPGGSAPGSRGGIRVDGPQGFLFKPVSDSDGKLVVLLPKKFSGKVKSLVIRDSTGKVIDKGRATGIGNGDREHFRFKKAGASYPPNVTVEVTLEDGTTKSWPIGDPSQRYD